MPPSNNPPGEASPTGIPDNNRQFPNGNGPQFPFGAPFPLPMPPLVMPNSNQSNMLESPLIMSLLNKFLQQSLPSQGNKPEELQGPDNSITSQTASKESPLIHSLNQNSNQQHLGDTLINKDDNAADSNTMTSQAQSPHAHANLVAFMNSLLRMSNNQQNANSCLNIPISTNSSSEQSLSQTNSMSSPETTTASISSPISPKKFQFSDSENIDVVKSISEKGHHVIGPEQKLIA